MYSLGHGSYQESARPAGEWMDTGVRGKGESVAVLTFSKVGSWSTTCTRGRLARRLRGGSPVLGPGSLCGFPVRGSGVLRERRFWAARIWGPAVLLVKSHFRMVHPAREWAGFCGVEKVCDSGNRRQALVLGPSRRLWCESTCSRRDHVWFES